VPGSLRQGGEKAGLDHYGRPRKIAKGVLLREGTGNIGLRVTISGIREKEKKGIATAPVDRKEGEGGTQSAHALAIGRRGKRRRPKFRSCLTIRKRRGKGLLIATKERRAFKGIPS